MQASKKLYVILFLWFYATLIFATEQISDLVIYKGDTLYLSGTFDENFPLYEILINEKYKDKFTLNETCESTDCYRGYQAVWEIKNNKIYLKEIIDCCTEKPIDVKIVFGKKARKKKGIKAFWINRKLLLSSEPMTIFNIRKNIDFIDIEVNKGRISQIKYS